jgi:hypothetical protein
MDANQAMERLQEQFDALSRELDEQRKIVAKLERGSDGGGSGETYPAEGDRVGFDGRTDRRHLLTKAGVAAVGVVAGGAALALVPASPAAAAAGVFDGNPAVSGTASPTNGTGVVGMSSSGYGTQGFTTSGRGVYGEAGETGWGVQGRSSSGSGVEGESFTGVGVRATVITDAATQLVLAGNVALPLASRSAGSIVKDANNDVWYCVGGTQYRKLAGAATAGAFHALATPKRVYDSRPGELPATGPKTPLAAATPRTIDLKGNSSGVPAGCTAVLVNLVATKTQSSSAGFMSIYRNGIAFPGTSNLNWSFVNQSIAVTTITAVDSEAQCIVYAGSGTDVVIDVLGYYQ